MEEHDSIIGKVISHYHVLSRIAVGGMGEVYLAHDNSLERSVALKILPARLASDEEHLLRFMREAKTASALNHPNIITIYEIGREGPMLFIATEYIEGENLRAHLSRSRLSILEALDIAIQTASAVAAAHEAGVVHRDIKPENLMLRRDGILKVLDFGLAKLTDTWDRSVDRAAQTVTALETVPGTVLGTTVYMSPEQARGKAVDERTDIWSIGVLLYEMVTGHIPFAQDTTSDVIAAILKTTPPPLTNYVAQVPSELERVVEKALQKDQNERYQGVKDLLVDLRRLKKQIEFETELESFTSAKVSGARLASSAHRSASGATVEPKQRITALDQAHATSSVEYIVSNISRHKRYAFVGIALFAVMLLAASYGLYKLFSRGGSSDVRSLQVSRFTATGKAVHAAISPDGRYVAYVADEGGQPAISIGQVAATGTQVQIVPPGAAHYRGLSFTRDGEFLYYVVEDKNNPDGALFQIPVLGGVPRKVLSNIQSPIALSPDGKKLAFVRYSSLKEDALVIANVDGSGVTELAKHSSPDFFSTMAPAWSPDGSRIACVYQNTSGGYYENVVSVSVTDGKDVPIATRRWWQVGQLAWLADGRSLIASATEQDGSLPQLWQIPMEGTAKRITNDLNGYIDVSLTADSKTLVSVRSDRLVNIWLAAANDLNSARQITSGTERDDGMRGLVWTPTGKIIYRSVAGGEPNVWIMSADGSGQSRLTSNTSQSFDPVVSPDGRHVVWGSRRTGNTNLWEMELDGENPRQITTGVGEYFPEYSPDGQSILYTAYDPASSFWSIWKISVQGGPPTRMTAKESAVASISPDGKLFACNYEEQPGAGYSIAVVPTDGGPPQKMFAIPGPFARTIHWTADGRALTYVDTKAGVSNIWRQDLNGGSPQQLTNFTDQSIFGFAWSRDGKQLAISRGVVNSDVVMLKEFGP